MAIRTVYRPGDFLRDCDRCGETKYASETSKQWDGLIVCTIGCFEARHPQDLVKGRVDRQNVPDPRPTPAYRFLGPVTAHTTADAVAGQSFLLLDATTGMSSSDVLQVADSGGNVRRVTILTVTSAVRIDLAAGLPAPVTSGALVTDVSAVTTANLG